MSCPEAPAVGAEPPDHLTVIACPSTWTTLITPELFGVRIAVKETVSPLDNAASTPVKLIVLLLLIKLLMLITQN